MGLKKLKSTSPEIHKFCTEMIYEILQRKASWVFPESPFLLEQVLFEEFLQANGLKTLANFKQRLSQSKPRRAFVLNFNSCVKAWLERHYPQRAHFSEFDEVIYHSKTLKRLKANGESILKKNYFSPNDGKCEENYGCKIACSAQCKPKIGSSCNDTHRNGSLDWQ